MKRLEKLIFFATSEFAIPSLEKLLAGSYEIVAVITQPDKPAGRKQKPLPSPVKVWALEHGLEVLQPTSLSSPLQALRGMKGEVELPSIDLAIVASYGKIIPKEILNVPKFGTLNIHPSLLPKYRGPSPIHAAILNGDAETGVTIIKLDEELDHGPIVATASCKLQAASSFKELHDKLAKLGTDLLAEILPKYIRGEIKPVPQDHAIATYTKIITKADARIDWNFSAEKTWSMVRAYEIWPVAWTTLNGKRLKIFKAQSISQNSTSLFPSPGLERVPKGGEVELPGTILIDDSKLHVHCGPGLLELLELQLEGGKVLDAKSFLLGHRNLAGKVLE